VGFSPVYLREVASHLRDVSVSEGKMLNHKVGRKLLGPANGRSRRPTKPWSTIMSGTRNLDVMLDKKR